MGCSLATLILEYRTKGKGLGRSVIDVRNWYFIHSLIV